MLVAWKQEQITVVNNFIAEHLQEYGYRPVLELTQLTNDANVKD